jgi:Tfp pilus assembly protein PilF
LGSGLAFAQTPAQPPDPAYEPLTKAYEAIRARNYDDGIARFLKAIAAAPDRPAVRKDLAYTYLKIGENTAARDQFREAIRLDPKDFHVALEYAFLCNETKEQAQARRVFDRVRKAGDPESRAPAKRDVNQAQAERAAQIAEKLHGGNRMFIKICGNSLKTKTWARAAAASYSVSNNDLGSSDCRTMLSRVPRGV